MKKPKHVDTVFNSIQPLPLPITDSISNTHKNQRPQVDIFAPIFQNIFLQTNILVLTEFVIYMTVQHHIPRTKLFYR